MARKFWGRTRLVSLPKVRCIFPDHIYVVAASQAPVVQHQCECADHEQETIHAQEKASTSSATSTSAIDLNVHVVSCT